LFTDVVVGTKGDGDGLGDGDGEADGVLDGVTPGVVVGTAAVPGPAHAASTSTARQAPIDLTTEVG